MTGETNIGGVDNVDPAAVMGGTAVRLQSLE